MRGRLAGTSDSALSSCGPSPPLNSQGSQPAATPMPGADDQRMLSVTLQGHTANLESVTALVDRMNHNPAVFKDPKPGPEIKMPRTQEFLFSIVFGYLPPKAAAPAAPTPK